MIISYGYGNFQKNLLTRAFFGFGLFGALGLAAAALARAISISK